jgi:hypothetical protein
VLVDHELVATLVQVDERDRPVNAGDLDRAVELDRLDALDDAEAALDALVDVPSIDAVFAGP